MLSVRESNPALSSHNQPNSPYMMNQAILPGGDAFTSLDNSRNKNRSKTIQDTSSNANKQIQAALYNPQKSIGRQSGNSKLSIISESGENTKGMVSNEQAQ